MTTDYWNRSQNEDLQVSDMARRMLKPAVVRQDMKATSEKSSTSIDNLYKAVNDIAIKADKNAAKQLEESKRWAQTVIDFIAEFKKKPEAKNKENREDKTHTQYLSKIAEASNNLWRASQSQHTIWVGICKLTGQAQKDIADAIRMSGCCGATNTSMSNAANQAVNSVASANNVTAATKSALSGGAGGGRGGGGGGHGGPMNHDSGGHHDLGGANKAAGRWFAVASILQTVGATLERIHRGMINALDINPMKIFDGLITDSNKFAENIRAIVHETQGYGKANREIEESFRHITQHVEASGSTRGEYQAMYLKNLERGLSLATAEDKFSVRGLRADKQEAALIKAKAERMQHVQTTALHTANALHMNAEAMNELFMDWHMHIGMSEVSMGEIGRHMQSVARNTGVTGSQLESAMKNAAGVVKNLKDAGVASVDAVKKVTSFMAAAQKHGFEQGAEMMNALASRQGFLESKQKLFLVNAASRSGNPNAVNDLVMGRTLQTPNGMKDMMAGTQNFVRQLFGNFRGALASVGVNADEVDASNLSEVIQKLQGGDATAQAAAVALQRQFAGLGTTIGQVEQMFNAMKEDAMSPMERIDEMTKKLATLNAQGLGKTDEAQRLQKKILESQTSMSMDAFGRINKYAVDIQKNGGVISEEIKQKLIKDMSTMFGGDAGAANWLNNLQGNAKQTVAQASERAKASGVSLDELLRKRGIAGGQAELEQLLKSGNILGITALTEAMQEIGIKEKRSEDPITEIREILRSWNNQLGGWFDGIRFGLGETVTQIMYWGGFLAGILFNILSAFAVFKGLSALGRIAGLLPAAGGAGGAGGLTSALSGVTAAAVGKVVAPLMLLVGGVKGYLEAEAAGRSKLEGTLFGALTGGAKTGSFVSSTLGVEKGSTTDKALGVGGSMLWGAGLGAAIGSFFPVIGTAIGAGVGAIIGGVTEIIKIWTEGTTAIYDTFEPIITPISRLFNRLGEGFGEILKAFGLLDMNLGVFGSTMKIASDLFVTLINGFGMEIQFMAKVIGGVLTFIVDAVFGFADLIAKIFVKPQEILSHVYDFCKIIWDDIYKGFKWLWDVLVGHSIIPDLINGIIAWFTKLPQKVMSAMVEFGAAAISGLGKFMVQLPAMIWDAIKKGLNPFSGQDVAENMGKQNNTMSELTDKANKKLLKEAQDIKDPQERIQELQRQLARQEMMEGGAKKNIESYNQKLKDDRSWILPESLDASVAPNKALISGEEKRLQQIQMQKEIIKRELAAANAAATTTGGIDNDTKASIKKMAGDSEITADTMAMGQKKGSIFVHDTHCEALLIMLLQHFGAWDKHSESKARALQMSLEDRAKSEQAGTTTMAMEGAFAKGEVGDAADAVIHTDLNKAMMTMNVEKTEDVDKVAAATSSITDLKTAIQCKECVVVGASVMLTGAFEHGESRNAIDSSIERESNKMSYMGTMIGTAIAGPVGAVAGFVHDTIASGNTIGEALDQTINNISKNSKGITESLSMGLFDSDKPEEAQDSHTSSMISKIFGTSDLNNVVSSALDTSRKFHDRATEKNIVAEVSRVLDYERSASDAANATKATEFSNSDESSSNVTTSLMDYRDQIRGEVGTLGLSRTTMENAVAQAQYGDQLSGGSVILPSMDAIADYLIVSQAGKLDDMIELLARIEGRLSGGLAGTQIIGSSVASAGPPTRPGIKNISRDLTRGSWDLTYGDYSSGSVTTEGRGGSA